MPTRSRSIAALAAAASFAVPLLVSLGTNIPAIRRVPLGVDEREAGFPAPLHGRWSVEADGTFYLLRLGLRATDPDRLIEHQEIALEILQFEGPLDMADASLSFDGVPCAYRADGRSLALDGVLTLQRGVGCSPLNVAPSGTMLLTLRLRAAKPAALRAAVRRAAPPGAVVISRFGIEAPPGVLIARGTVADVVAGRASERRVTLLAYVWGLSASAVWIVVIVLAASSMICAAVLLAPSRPVVATSLSALALATTYAVVVPPFQAADEPNHFLAVADVLTRHDLVEEGAAFARRAHFEELRSAGRPFTPLDRDNPGLPWVGISAPNGARGDGASALWLLLTPVMRRASAPRVLLTLRLFHGLLFAVSAGLFVLAISRLTDARRPELLAIPIFLVPTLTYFGMHLSNYAPLVSLYVLFAAGTAVALWDGSRAHFAAPLLGLAVTLGMALSRSAVPLAGLATGIAFAHICLGDRTGRREHSAMYWALMTGTLIVGLSLVNLAYPEGPERELIRYDVAHGRLAWLLHNPWWLAVPGAALAGIEIAVSSITRRLSAPSRIRAAIVRVTAYTAGIATAMWVIASPWLDHPAVQSLNGASPVGLSEYVREVVPACLAMMRFGRPDDLTSLTFWGGFGWLETLLPEWLVSALAGTSGLAFAGLLLWAGWRRSGRALFWIACAAAGYLVAAAAYAFTARLIFADVHGRYLLGLYLAALVIAWSGVARWAESGRITRPGLVVATAAACALAVHVYALTFLLARYF